MKCDVADKLTQVEKLMWLNLQEHAEAGRASCYFCSQTNKKMVVFLLSSIISADVICTLNIFSCDVLAMYKLNLGTVYWIYRTRETLWNGPRSTVRRKEEGETEMKLIYQPAILGQAKACCKRPIKDLLNGPGVHRLCWCYRVSTVDFLLCDCVDVAELLSLFCSSQTIFLCADHQGSLYQQISVSAQSHVPQCCHCFLSSISSSILLLVYLSQPCCSLPLCLWLPSVSPWDFSRRNI